MKRNYTRTFLNEVVKLEPIEYIGLLKLVGIEIKEEDFVFENTFAELLSKFDKSSTRFKKDIIKALREVSSHGSTTKDSKD